MPLGTTTILISTQNLQVISDPHTKPCQFWSIHWNQVNSGPPHRNHVYFDHPHNNQVYFHAKKKTCHFRAVLLCVLYISVHVLVMQQQCVEYNFEYQVVLFLTFPYWSTTRKIFRTYIYKCQILYFASWYIHDYAWYWWPDLVTFHSCCTYEYFLVSYIPAYHQMRILPMYGAVPHCSF